MIRFDVLDSNSEMPVGGGGGREGVNRKDPSWHLKNDPTQYVRKSYSVKLKNKTQWKKWLNVFNQNIATGELRPQAKLTHANSLEKLSARTWIEFCPSHSNKSNKNASMDKYNRI